jgi:hypothetical protein
MYRPDLIVASLLASIALTVTPSPAFSEDAASTSGCDSAASREAKPGECTRVIVVDSGDAAVALSSEQRLAFFKAYNQDRLKSQTAEAGSRDDRACDEVVNVGYFRQNDFWLIKCSDGRSIAANEPKETGEWI